MLEVSLTNFLYDFGNIEQLKKELFLRAHIDSKIIDDINQTGKEYNMAKDSADGVEGKQAEIDGFDNFYIKSHITSHSINAEDFTNPDFFCGFYLKTRTTDVMVKNFHLRDYILPA